MTKFNSHSSDSTSRGANPELVPYFDFTTKKVTFIPKAELSPHAVLIQLEGKPGPMYADANQIKMQTEAQHGPFGPEKRALMQRFATELSDVLPKSAKQWEAGFSKDRNPDNEIKIWIRITDILKAMTERCTFGAAQRKECLNLLLACTFGPSDTVRSRSHLTLLNNEQIEQIIESYYAG